MAWNTLVLKGTTGSPRTLSIDLQIRQCKENEGEEGEVATAQANGKHAESTVSPLRAAIARQFNNAEDVVYVGLAFLLACSAGALLVTTGIELFKSILDGTPLKGIVSLLDRLLLILMIVELLGTVQVSFRAHALVPEPFLIVGLIAVTRRILVVSAEFSSLLEQGLNARFREATIELALLTAMVLALVVSLRMLQRRNAPVAVL